jgi:hypothetical protein
MLSGLGSDWLSSRRGMCSLEHLVPDWPLLQWRLLEPVGDLGHNEWEAETAELRLQVGALAGASADPRRVLKLFNAVMSFQGGGSICG